MSRARNLLANGLKSVAILLACSLMLNAAAPPGWYVAGSKPAEYESGVDAQAAYNGHPSAYLKAKQPLVDGFGTLMQDFRAEKYAGKRVRFTAQAKTEGVQDWAGLWMRVDKGPTMLAFDNMQDRPMKGTSAWQNYEVVLDVPQDATGIFFGVLLTGSGTVWLNNTKFEVVGPEVHTTGAGIAQHRDSPANLNFEN
jgi:hypothetical protein